MAIRDAVQTGEASMSAGIRIVWRQGLRRRDHAAGTFRRQITACRDGGGEIMEAYRAERLGGSVRIGPADIATPEPGPGQIRIAVRAAGLHLADAAALAGQRQPHLPRRWCPASRFPARSAPWAPM